MTIVGVLAIQGAFVEHINHFQTVIELHKIKNVEVIKVNNKEALYLCDALVIPGGESSSISLTAERIGMLEPLIEFVRNQKNPVWGTCAGLIFLSSKITNALPSQRALGGLDIEVKRNAFGRQLESFVKNLNFSAFIENCDEFLAVFIRAPVVTDVNISFRETEDFGAVDSVYAADFGKIEFPEEVQVLSRLDENHHNLIVAIRQGKKLGTSFHPELSDDTRLHKWFLEEFVLHFSITV